MKKTLILLIFVFGLSGCATYKFQKPNTTGAEGYLAYYDGKPLAEYTVGKEKSLPDLVLAKERFKRRRTTVEYYYKQMDQIESRFKEFFWDAPSMVVGFLSGVIRWPFIAVADYKYNHNLEYKHKVDRLEEEKEALETARVNSLRKKLDTYIVQDLSKESGEPVAAELVSESAVIEEVTPKIETAPIVPALSVEPVVVTPPPTEIKLVAVKKAPVVKKVPIVKKMPVKILLPPVAVIIAQPLKGYSPLLVKFSAGKSYSKSGKIVAYLWEFGDGDTSTKKNSENTYWSTTFGVRNFTTTLTVRDDAGNTSVVTTVVEVITR